jgi:hypothetical protein
MHLVSFSSSFGVAFADPKQFSFGLVWFLIAAAKIFLVERSSKVKRSG